MLTVTRPSLHQPWSAQIKGSGRRRGWYVSVKSNIRTDSDTGARSGIWQRTCVKWQRRPHIISPPLVLTALFPRRPFEVCHWEERWERDCRGRTSGCMFSETSCLLSSFCSSSPAASSTSFRLESEQDRKAKQQLWMRHFRNVPQCPSLWTTGMVSLRCWLVL